MSETPEITRRTFLQSPGIFVPGGVMAVLLTAVGGRALVDYQRLTRKPMDQQRLIDLAPPDLAETWQITERIANRDCGNAVKQIALQSASLTLMTQAQLFLHRVSQPGYTPTPEEANFRDELIKSSLAAHQASEETAGAAKEVTAINDYIRQAQQKIGMGMRPPFLNAEPRHADLMADQQRQAAFILRSARLADIEIQALPKEIADNPINPDERLYWRNLGLTGGLITKHLRAHLLECDNLAAVAEAQRQGRLRVSCTPHARAALRDPNIPGPTLIAEGIVRLEYNDPARTSYWLKTFPPGKPDDSEQTSQMILDELRSYHDLDVKVEPRLAEHLPPLENPFKRAITQEEAEQARQNTSRQRQTELQRQLGEPPSR